MKTEARIFSLKWKDAAKGLIVAIITALLTGTLNAIQSNTLEFTWIFFKPIIIFSIGAGIAYIIKNFLTSSEDKFLTSEPKNTPEQNATVRK
ncbi:MAG: hypothetical protein WC390_07225 [Sulfurimonas sp.]|jgi:hypothetical protein